MATLPRFVFPLRHEDTNSEANSNASTTRKYKPQISLQMPTREGKGYTLSVPDAGYGRPGQMRAISTPPESPTRPRSYTMGATGLRNAHNSGAMTPPPTPTKGTHSKSSSASSIRNSLDSLRRGNSVSSRTRAERAPSVDQSEKPSSTEPRHFPYWATDYDIDVDHSGRKKRLGEGAWSKVYLAKPCLPKMQELMPPTMGSGSAMTPPVTPSHSRTSSLSKSNLPQIPYAYAVKEPNRETASPKVLEQECRILSYLSRFPGADMYIVSFYGQDTRNGALMLKAMDGTLEDWVQHNLNAIPEDARAAKLAEVFPSVALHLLGGLAWLGEKGCAHGDVKPGNILTSSSSSSSSIPQAVYTDFSSAIISAAPQASLGGATWDFLDPSLMTKATAKNPPTAVADLWSLAVTLLVLVIGSSPYDRLAPNSILAREYMKQGNPLLCMTQNGNASRNLARINALSESLGFDVMKWFAGVLVKDPSKRADAIAWRNELQLALAQQSATI